ncbi:anthranilate synthase component I [Butyrivibrio proteoclasticus]|uniref:anthranilate synthase component I n=1 Tax=Butyrivibrio proteoclasticus TaxID=43305 RepID=UPI00047CEB4E|nr:anthranilate synthase component I [Butyrivibrio proteoclasticus]
MTFYPDLDTIKTYAASGNYDIVPVSCTLLSDFITPIEVMRKLKKASTHCYMLESAQADEKWGRYTFLGYDPKLEITCINGHMKIGDSSFDTKAPSAHIRDIMHSHRSPKLSALPTFTGGLVGYFSYDYLTYSEPTAKVNVNDTEEFKDVDLMLFDKVIVFDNVTQKIILIANMNLNSNAAGSASDVSFSTLEDNYNEAVSELNKIKDLLINGEKQIEPKGKLLSPIKPLFGKETYSNMVIRAKKHIFEGDIFQIVLSNYLTADYEGSLFETYRRLRTINPSPYMFYFSGTDVEIAGASPETLVKLEDGVLHTFPLAGTRKRGTTEAEDIALEKELLADEKELAEHNMLVDLGRNDLGKISKFGTVEVEKLHSIERFSHVMHIGSTVRGIIRDDRDALDAIEAVLPAGTLSGAPKIRACQLIGALEGNKRGVYGGAIGYIDFFGNMDACIAIRLLYKKNGKVFVRSGAGIVADSNPEKEYEECINKAKAALTALENTMADEEGR